MVHSYHKVSVLQIMVPLFTYINKDNSSFSYANSAKSLEASALLRYAIGCPCYMRTALILEPEASTSTINSLEKSDKASTGASVLIIFKASKAY